MQTLEWLERLVGIDTTSRNSNLRLIEIVQDWFKHHGLASRLTYDAEKNKANLFATLPGKDGGIEGGLVLSGHTDVVPVDGQHWETDPFVLTEKNGKVYGRGTSDMKGFIATALALLPELQKMQLAQPIHFAFSYDEEVGCHGAPLLIEDIQKIGIKPKACIVGEPTLMHPVVAHKGIQAFRCQIHGRAAHSSLTPKGCNAIEYAAELICYIRHLADQFQKKGPFEEFFDVPFTSISTNMIYGGTAQNIIPEFCEFYFEFRHLPSVQAGTITDLILAYIENDLVPKMQKNTSDAKIEIDKLGAIPSFESDKEALITKLAFDLKGGEIKKVAYATEAGLFQQVGIPTIVCGPGSIEQAHRPNEYVAIDQLKECEAFLKKIVVM